MPTKRPYDSLTDLRPLATPETLSDIASQADLGQLDQKTALMVKLCEARTEKRVSLEITNLQARLAALQERYNIMDPKIWTV